MPTLYCPKCGYNLTGLTQSVCPECGEKFSRAELAAIGGIKHPPILWPMLWLLVPPGIFAGLSLVMFSIDGSSPDTDLLYTLILCVLWLCVAAGPVVSIITARRIARRLAMRPPKSRPNLNSVVLTVIFALLFFCAQCCIGFAGFFVGCLANFQI